MHPYGFLRLPLQPSRNTQVQRFVRLMPLTPRGWPWYLGRASEAEHFAPYGGYSPQRGCNGNPT